MSKVNRLKVIDELVNLGYTEGQEAVPYLTRYLGSLSTGKNAQFRDRNFYKNRTVQEILEIYLENIYSKFSSLPRELINLEKKERGSYNYFSRVLPFSERKETLNPFFLYKPKFNPEILTYKEAVRLTRNMFPIKRLRPASLQTSVDLARKNTQWGLPFCMNGRQSWELYYKLAEKFIKRGSFPYYPFILGTRTQPSGDMLNPKQRVVWMTSHCISLIESCYAIPFIKFMKSTPYYSALDSWDSVDSTVTGILKQAKRMNSPVISVDFSQYDSMNSSKLIDDAFDIFIDSFQSSEVDRSLLFHIREHFKTADLVTPEKIYKGRSHGVPSGSGLTNLIDSIIHTIIFHYVSLRMGYTGSSLPDHFICNGDDGVWLIPGIDPEKNEKIVQELGHISNKSKQGFGNYATFCQRYHSPDFIKKGLYVGVRSLTRTLTHMVFIERYQDSKVYNDGILSLRIIAQLEGCINHPYYMDFLRFCIEGDPLRLGLGIKGGLSSLFKLAGSGIYDVIANERYLLSQQLPGERIFELETFKILNDLYKLENKSLN